MRHVAKRSLMRMLPFKACSLGLLAPSTVATARYLPRFVQPTPPPPGCTYNGGGTLNYYFSNDFSTGVPGTTVGDTAWTDATKAAFRTGAQNWSALRGEAGVSTVLFNTFEAPGPGPGVFKVVRDSRDPSGATDCIHWAEKTIDVNAAANTQELQYLAGHEIGHAWGLRHSGAGDSLTGLNGLYDNGLIPLMSGCIHPTGTNYQLPKVDDWANVWHKKAGPSETPDGGFESLVGVNTFYLAGGPQEDSSVHDTGSYSMKLPGGSYMAQRVRITGANGGLLAKGRYKGNAAANNFKAQIRPISYGSSTGCYLDTPTVSTWYDISNGSVPTSGSWATWSHPAVTSLTNFDLQVYVNNNGSGVLMWVDNLELQNYP